MEGTCYKCNLVENIRKLYDSGKIKRRIANELASAEKALKYL